jgi:cbb3-type cytochrome oxidase subunit 3
VTADLVALAVLLLVLLGGAAWLLAQGSKLRDAQAKIDDAKEALDAARLKERYADERARIAERAARELAALHALPPGPARADRLRRLLDGSAGGDGPAAPGGGAPTA